MLLLRWMRVRLLFNTMFITLTSSISRLWEMSVSIIQFKNRIKNWTQVKMN